MPLPIPQTITHPQGVNYVPTITNTAGLDMTSWALRFRVRDRDGVQVLEKTSGAGDIVVGGTGGTQATVASGSGGLPVGDHEWDLWRVDDGLEDEVDQGPWLVTYAPQ